MNSNKPSKIVYMNNWIADTDTGTDMDKEI